MADATDEKFWYEHYHLLEKRKDAELLALTQMKDRAVAKIFELKAELAGGPSSEYRTKRKELAGDEEIHQATRDHALVKRRTYWTGPRLDTLGGGLIALTATQCLLVAAWLL